MQPYFFRQGIRDLSKEIRGNENVYLGIRPYGFHAGNELPLIIYPRLLARDLKKRGIEPQFSLYLFINDYEQATFDGPDKKKYPFNIIPKHTTFQHTMNPDGSGLNIVDYWQPIIEQHVQSIQDEFPQIKVTTVRNSEIKKDPKFRNVLLQTIKNPETQARIYEKFSKKEVLPNPIMYASAVCPKCKSARGETRIIKNDMIQVKCTKCGHERTATYDEFDYWFYHKPLALPRLSIFNIDICITGADHYKEGDFQIRQALIDLLDSQIMYPKTLYTPSILVNGEHMGKSKGNTQFIEYDKLIKIADETDGEILNLPST